jgi:hypothetical protein
MGTLANPRGTTNRNERGSAASRRARREWLVTTYRANVDAAPPNPLLRDHPELQRGRVAVPVGKGEPACRCYRCGVLLTVETVTADRIIPGCKGGTYRRNNIRPACGLCNSETGGRLATRRKS